MPIKLVILLIYEFMKKTDFKTISEEYKVGKKGYNNVLKNIRRIIGKIKVEKKGGKNQIVEIDETCISRRKYNVWRLKKMYGLFVGYPDHQKNSFWKLPKKEI